MIMKKYIFLIAVGLMVFTTIFSQNKKTMEYIDNWKKVDEFERKSLPKSAAAEVNNILLKAISDSNHPQAIKAVIHLAKYELNIDYENDTYIFHKLNQMIDSSNNSVEKSVMHSMLGEMYIQYYQRSSWEISKKTDLGDFVPDDMKEWTRNIFYNKVVEHMNASVEDVKNLEGVDVGKYDAVVSLGKSSRSYFPTMYDFLSQRRIDILKKLSSDMDLSRVLSRKKISVEDLFASTDSYIDIEFNAGPREYNIWVLEAYRDYLSSLVNRGMKESALLVELQKLDYLQILPTYYEKYSEKFLRGMLQKWYDSPLGVEIVDKLTTLLNQKVSRAHSDENLQYTKEIYDILKQYIDKYPKYERIGLLENKLNNLVSSRFTLSGSGTFPVKGDKKFSISYRNLTSLKLKLYKVESSVAVLENNYNRQRLLKDKSTFVKDIDLSFLASEEYLFNNYDFEISIDKPGVYMLLNSDEGGLSKTEESKLVFSVSDLSVFSRAVGNNEYEFFVVDRVSGKHIPGASVDIYKLPNNWLNSHLILHETMTTNDIGLARYKKDIPNYDVYYSARLKDDSGSTLNRLPGSFFSYSETSKDTERVSIFTDRSIYRLGQTVYFKAIATRTENDKTSLVTNKKIDFKLRGANGEDIASQTISVNDYGSASGEFVLPANVLTGHFVLYTSQGSVTFRVEEYKRPTFDITFDKVADTYSFGEEVKIKGLAESFSGIALQDAEVSYTITRQQMWWRMWGGNAVHFAEGVVQTGSDGAFEITFTPEKDDSISKQIYSFVIDVSVTDINGETQSSEYTVVVGDISMMLSLGIKDKLEKSSDDKIVITALNLDGGEISATGKYEVYSLSENDSINKLVISGNFEVGEQPKLKTELISLNSGKYHIKLISEDNNGKEVNAEQDVVIFSYKDKRPPIKTNEWLVVKNSSLSNDKPGEVIFGVSDDVNVLYELWQENRLLERKWIKLNNENKLFSFPYKNTYKNGITLMLTYVKDERFYTQAVDMVVKNEAKDLNISIDVFRDKIRPGAKEEWRISVKDIKGSPVAAEVLASMYDLSLDKIYQSSKWMLNTYSRNSYWSMMGLRNDASNIFNQATGSSSYTYKKVEQYIFDVFNWYGFGFPNMMMLRGARMAMPAPTLQSKIADVVELSSGYDEVIEVEEEKVMGGAENNNSVSDNIRRNFDETAFFFPQLVTNEKGETQIAFTVPDSNTKWKFRLLAHDKNLNVGYAEAVTMSQKELMITPNMPRFVRQGDKTSISTKISNLSDDTISGVAKIEFFNPMTDEKIIISTTGVDNKEFSIDEGASAQVSWLFEVPSEIDLLGVRIVAQSENFSDGEQHSLVVLPNKMLVTETLRMDLNGNQEKSFVFDRLIDKNSKTRKDYRLTLEFTANPAWYAVQALPVLSTPDNENSISWFAAYYANKLGAHIADAYPKVKRMVDAWKQTGGNAETLLSNLEKNEELKSVLLQETPWVLEAKNETEQKERLSLLFDLNRSDNISRKAIEKLNKLQTYQGGWSWFEGMRPNVGITHYILYGFNQLNTLGIDDNSEITLMQSKAIKYIDDEALLRFERMKKFNKDWKKITSISSVDLEYLYVRILYPNFDMTDAVKDMVEFYTRVISSNWTKYDLYERSLISIIMNQKGNNKIEQDIIKSYREHSTVNEEMGMYWANNRSTVFMSQSAVAVHTFIMKAFTKAGATPKEMDEMKRWLLKQKQTQLWESTHATLDAVYALLSTGSDWFGTDGETNIVMGGKTVDSADKEIGTGYIKTSWSNTEIKPEMGNIDVSHKGNSPAWGSLYLQYFEELDKIESASDVLNVNKQLFVEHTDSEGKKLFKINDEDTLKIGDRVVMRLTIRTDRDMEFVHLKDMRSSCFEPVEQLSGIRWDGKVTYYSSPGDASTNYYFDTLPRGTYVLEYQVVVNREGEYSNGITTIQSMYAPEFVSHTAGVRINVK